MEGLYRGPKRWTQSHSGGDRCCPTTSSGHKRPKGVEPTDESFECGSLDELSLLVRSTRIQVLKQFGGRYPVQQDYCVLYDEFDVCIQGTRKADNLVLCKSTPGVERGIYLVGVFIYCMPADPFFPPAPPPASFTYNGLNKNRCDNQTMYNLYVTPFEHICSTPLIQNAPRVSIVVCISHWFRVAQLESVQRQSFILICRASVMVTPTPNLRTAGLDVFVIKSVGNPDIFISSQDGSPALGGFVQMLRTNRNGKLLTNAGFQEHQSGRQYISVSCSLGAQCPATFILENLLSIWDDMTHENSYTSFPGEIRRFQREYICTEF